MNPRATEQAASVLAMHVLVRALAFPALAPVQVEV